MLKTDPKPDEISMSLATFSLLTVVVLLPGGTVWRAFVAVTLWRWFAVPALHLSELSMPMAAGLSLVWSVFAGGQIQTPPPDPTKTKREKQINNLMRLFGKAVLYPLLLLAMGWIVLRFQ